MIKKIAAYILSTAGFIGFVYFERYRGDVIPYPFAWLILSVLAGITGIYLLVNAGKKSIRKSNYVHTIANAEKILLTPGNCTVVETNYYEEITNNSISEITVLDAVYDPGRNHRRELIEQSAIIYYHETAGEKIKMTSQSFPCNAATLRGYIANGDVAIFVNPSDKEDYEFEILG